MRLSTCIAVLLTSFATVGPAWAATANNELVIATSNDIRSINGTGRDAITDSVLHHIYETLVGFRSDLTVGPALADSWKISEDGKVYTFHLRPGAKFHNGDPITAADVKWSWDFHMNPKRDVSCRANFDGSRSIKLESIETPDDQTVVFTIAEPSGLMLTRLAEIQCNLWVASPKNADADGNWIAGSAIGSGPFKLDKWSSGESITLKRFEDYVPSAEPRSGYAGNRSALVDTLKFQIIPDYTVQEVALQSGDIDVMNNVQAARAHELEAKGLTLSSSPGLGWSTFLLQTNDPLLSKLEIRRAIAMAIDYDQIAGIRTGKMSAANHSAVADSSAYHTPAFAEWPAYDPAAARALAAKAGYKGEKITIQTNNRYQNMYENGILLQAMLMAAGFNAEIETLEWGTQLDRFNKGAFQIQSFAWSARLDPALNFGSFIGDKAADPSNQWDNAKAHALYQQALVEPDIAKRGVLFETLHKMMVDEMPIIGLYYAPNVSLTRPNVQGYSAWPADNSIGWGVSKK